MGHHHDGLALLAVDQLQQVEDLFRRGAIEVAGGFVADQQRGVRDEGPRDRHALLFPTTSSAGDTAVTEAHEVQGRGDAGATLRFRQLRKEQRQFDILFGDSSGMRL